MLEDQGLALAERPGERVGVGGVVDGAGVGVEHAVVAVEGAVVLADRLEGTAGRRPRPPLRGVRVRHRVDAGADPVDLRVDGEGGPVDRDVGSAGRCELPSKSTHTRSSGRISRHEVPSGFTQNRSACPGSRTLMWPATQCS